MEYYRKMIKTIFSILISFVLLVNIAAAGDKISEDVKSMMQIGEKVPVIILLKDQPSLKSLSKDEPSFTALSKENAIALRKSHASLNQKNIAALLQEEKSNGKADKIQGFWIVNAIALDASPELIEKLEKRDDVERIELDAKLSIVNDFSAQVSPGQITNATDEIKRINATKVWELGIDGTGINVSVIDTGIDGSHPDLTGRVIKWVDFVNGNNAFSYDDNTHGTHVAGTVGGNGSRGVTTGVAPNVSLFGVKALDSTGNGNYSSVILGIQWSVENRADVISMSIGGDNYISSNCDSTSLNATIYNAVALNITVIAAAGNNGTIGVTDPACISSTIAVGSVDSSDIIASSSGRGAAMADHGVVAPGVSILSTFPKGTCKYCIPPELDFYYEILSGTSQATPHVSGTVALLLQAARKNGTSLTPALIRSILQNTSIDLGDPGKDDIYGAGRINVSNATAAVSSYAATIGQNTYVQLSNGSFGIVLKGRDKTINNSLILNNTGDTPAKVEARFSNNVSGVFGMVSGENVLNATSFALGIPGNLICLNETGSSVEVATAQPGVTTVLDARLIVPSGQPSGDYSGTVILIFSN